MSQKTVRAGWTLMAVAVLGTIATVRAALYDAYESGAQGGFRAARRMSTTGLEAAVNTIQRGRTTAWRVIESSDTEHTVETWGFATEAKGAGK